MPLLKSGKTEKNLMTAKNNNYRVQIKSQLKKDAASFCTFRKEEQMDYLFDALAKQISENDLVLDACCGYGRFVHFLIKRFPKISLHGVDYVEELIQLAKENFKNQSNVTFECKDIFTIANDYPKHFDYSICYKTIYVLPDYKEIIKVLFSVTKKKVYITCPFYDGNLEFLSKINLSPQESRAENFAILNIYSYPQFEKFCLSSGAKSVKSWEMSISHPLNKSNPDTMHTYTEEIVDGKYIEINGIFLLNWKLVEINLE